VQLDTGGNRRLDHALRIAAMVGLRSHSASQPHLTRQIAEGKTQRAATRQLETLIARRLHRVLNEPDPSGPNRGLLAARHTRFERGAESTLQTR